MRVNRAETQQELLHAIDIVTLNDLCTSIIDLLERFQALGSVIDEKVKDEKIIKQWRNISLGIALAFGAIVLIGSGAGAAVGLPALALKAQSFSGVACVLGLSSAGIAQKVLEMSTFEPIRKNLEEIKRLLAQLSKQYATMDGMAGELRMEDKKELLLTLKEAKAEVDKGYAILGGL